MHSVQEPRWTPIDGTDGSIDSNVLQVPLKYQPTTPENYISVTKEAFQDVSDYIGDEALGCRIMGGKRGEHTVGARPFHLRYN